MFFDRQGFPLIDTSAALQIVVFMFAVLPLLSIVLKAVSSNQHDQNTMSFSHC